MISLIWAMDTNNVIGLNNKIPWKLPADLFYFKKITNNHKIVMGRKTFESIGKPLANRENIILTNNKDYIVEGCTIIHNINEILKLGENEEIFIIGGAKIYSEFLPYADRLYTTFINGKFEGDTYFPEVDMSSWKLTLMVQGKKDKNNPYEYYFCLSEREKNGS